MAPYDEIGLPVVAAWKWVVCIVVWLLAGYGLVSGLRGIWRNRGNLHQPTQAGSSKMGWRRVK